MILPVVPDVYKIYSGFVEGTGMQSTESAVLVESAQSISVSGLSGTAGQSSLC